jgi:hypothetical protein
MKLSKEAIIAASKLNQYLLVKQRRNDKSQWLATVGYSLENWVDLECDLREQILTLDAVLIEKNLYGDVYEITGSLRGPSGKEILVRTVWMDESATGEIKFITLFPDKRRGH